MNTDALDAARYRWLRDKATSGQWERASHLPPKMTDEYIDQFLQNEEAAYYDELERGYAQDRI